MTTQKWRMVPVEPTPEPEPVAWMYEDAFGTHFAEEYSEISNNPGVLSFTALYTIQPALPADVALDAEPVAYVTGVYGGHTTVAPIDAAQVLRVGVALYTAPPAPSVSDGWRIVPYTPTVQMLERAAYAVNNRPQPSKYEPSATPAIIFWTAMLNYAPEAVFINSCSKPPKLSDERIWELIGEYKALSGASGKEARLVNLARAIERELLGGEA